MQYTEIQTPHDLIRAYRTRTKHQFGQHFLSDPSILTRMCAHARLGQGDHVLEIGPGCGTLTWMMLQHGASVHAIEIDRDAIAFLETMFADAPFELTAKDARKVDWPALLDTHDAPWTCIANLPYNVGTSIFLELTKHAHRFKSLTLMFQKEVAQRIVASEGDKAYGSLSLAMRLHYDTSLVMKLPPGAFSPPPKVHSAVVHCVPVAGTRIPDPDVRAMFERVIRAAFQQRRKKLSNGLKSFVAKNILMQGYSEVGLGDNARAEELSFEQFEALAAFLVGAEQA